MGVIRFLRIPQKQGGSARSIIEKIGKITRPLWNALYRNGMPKKNLKHMGEAAIRFGGDMLTNAMIHKMSGGGKNHIKTMSAETNAIPAQNSKKRLKKGGRANKKTQSKRGGQQKLLKSKKGRGKVRRKKPGHSKTGRGKKTTAKRGHAKKGRGKNIGAKKGRGRKIGAKKGRGRKIGAKKGRGKKGRGITAQTKKPVFSIFDNKHLQ